MTKKFIHVNSHIARHNVKHKEHQPPIALRQGRSGKPSYSHRIDLLDNKGNVVASVISDPARPLSCSATIWIETNLSVVEVNNDLQD